MIRLIGVITNKIAPYIPTKKHRIQKKQAQQRYLSAEQAGQNKPDAVHLSERNVKGTAGQPGLATTSSVRANPEDSILERKAQVTQTLAQCLKEGPGAYGTFHEAGSLFIATAMTLEPEQGVEHLLEFNHLLVNLYRSEDNPELKALLRSKIDETCRTMMVMLPPELVEDSDRKVLSNNAFQKMEGLLEVYETLGVHKSEDRALGELEPARKAIDEFLRCMIRFYQCHPDSVENNGIRHVSEARLTDIDNSVKGLVEQEKNKRVTDSDEGADGLAAQFVEDSHRQSYNLKDGSNLLFEAQPPSLADGTNRKEYKQQCLQALKLYMQDMPEAMQASFMGLFTQRVIGGMEQLFQLAVRARTSEQAGYFFIPEHKKCIDSEKREDGSIKLSFEMQLTPGFAVASVRPGIDPVIYGDQDKATLRREVVIQPDGSYEFMEPKISWSIKGSGAGPEL